LSEGAIVGKVVTSDPSNDGAKDGDGSGVASDLLLLATGEVIDGAIDGIDGDIDSSEEFIPELQEGIVVGDVGTTEAEEKFEGDTDIVGSFASAGDEKLLPNPIGGEDEKLDTLEFGDLTKAVLFDIPSREATHALQNGPCDTLTGFVLIGQEVPMKAPVKFALLGRTFRQLQRSWLKAEASKNMKPASVKLPTDQPKT